MTSLSSTQRTSGELLRRAVHRNRSLSTDGALERLFTALFRNLVYPMIWEDPRVDLAALQIRPDSRIVTIDLVAAAISCDAAPRSRAGAGAHCAGSPLAPDF